jgi:PAS domain S-box-containing protein
MFGYSGAEMVGRSGSRVFPLDRADEMKAIGAKITAGQPVERLDSIRVHKDGTAFPVSVTISPIRDKHGAITGVSAITRSHR